ncbi:MAG: calcium-binding protein, partial [Candidatus Saccharibacteria bacterium]|nr:calcium-binding protein [Pseudorhodobacter sp.]
GGDAGADLLDGGSGSDAIIGGEGMDSLLGQAGNDALQGGAGADQLAGGFGADTLDGNDGNDTIWGDVAGLSLAEGGTGVSGPVQIDFLNGGAGDDVLHVGAGDYASGGTGADDFALHDIAPGQALMQIMDFNRDEDSLVMQYDASVHTAPQITVVTDPGSPDATVLLDGVPVAQVLGGAGLTAGDVALQAA